MLFTKNNTVIESGKSPRNNASEAEESYEVIEEEE